MNNEKLKEIAISILLFCIVLIIIIFCICLVLNQFSPFNQCQNKTDNYLVKLGRDYFTCGELKAINTSISLT